MMTTNEKMTSQVDDGQAALPTFCIDYLLRVGKAIGCAEARGASVNTERERCASLRSAHP
ncbi:MAG: hypothetical protein ABL884_02685 [Methyloglobulus sp.]